MSNTSGKAVADGNNVTFLIRRPQDPLGDFLPVERVAEAIGVKRSTIYDLMKREDMPLPAPVKIGARTAWPEIAVIDWKLRLVLEQRGPAYLGELLEIERRLYGENFIEKLVDLSRRP